MLAKYKSKQDANGLGIGETITECNKAKYWFHSGNSYSSEIEWNIFNLKYQSNACNQSKVDAINKNHSGLFTFGPYLIPDPPCGKTVYLCGDKSYSTNDEFQNSDCGQRKKEEEKRKKEEEQRKKEEEENKGKDRCEGVSYNVQFCQSSLFINLDMCNCAPGGKWNPK